jgi:hypothetical protein
MGWVGDQQKSAVCVQQAAETQTEQTAPQPAKVRDTDDTEELQNA